MRIHTSALLLLFVYGTTGALAQRSTLSGRSVNDLQAPAATTILWEPGFPAGDSAAFARDAISAAIPGSVVVTADALPTALAQSQVLVLPYGSAFPEDDWPAMKAFLERGGNLVVIGGRPFTRPAYRDSSGTWKLRDESYAFARALNLIDYRPTASSQDTKFTLNDDTGALPAFAWKCAWSLVVRLSESDVSAREGSAGRIDARLTPLAWGVKDGRRLAAPVVQIDHLSGHFAGGRWIFVPAEVSEEFLKTGIVGNLVGRASDGARDFRVQVATPVLLPGEPINVIAEWREFGRGSPSAKLDIIVHPERGADIRQSVDLTAQAWPVSQRIQLPSSTGSGFHEITATLHSGNRRVVYRTGFWMRDREYLRSGPKLTTNSDFFLLDGRTLPVVGTTYMSSDAQRLFFEYPNPYVWDRDMNDIAASGLNMLRTGWWSGWNALVENGIPTDHTLRTMEAFLMTARRHNLPVQWTLFAFMPEVFGGRNPYLDPEAIRRQQQFLSSIATRFCDVPFLAWDLINEPSFDNPERFWSTRPNGDAAELEAWNKWLFARYGNKGAIASAWRAELPAGPIAVPENRDFAERAAYIGGHPIAAYDFHVFAQEKFASWAGVMQRALRAAGSTQVITVGQDEGGGTERPSPVFFAPQVDFTTTHTWWLNDALLWDSLVARVPGKPMLTQETGFQREWGVDGRPRRDPESEAGVLERKLAVALATGAGAIQWLWNVNSWMTAEQEVTIGAVRPDGTEKPEAEILRRFARFADSARDHMRDPEMPEVAIVTSQALQYSVLGNVAIEAQQRAVRTLEYQLHRPTYVVAENNLASLGDPKLVILPAPQALSDAAWQQLIDYVRSGGNLVITGPVERDDRWRPTSRLRDLGIEAIARPLVSRGGSIEIDGSDFPIEFGANAQLTLEALDITNGWAEKQIGKGTLMVAAYPVELAQGNSATRDVYLRAMKASHIEPQLQLEHLNSSVLVRPIYFADSILYLIMNETDAAETVSFIDVTTRTQVHNLLAPGRSALILLDRKTGAVLAKSD